MISSLTHVHRPVKVERLWRKAFRGLYNYFFINGYCVFEDDVYVDLSDVLDERPNYADITFSGLFAGPCADRPEVISHMIMRLAFFQGPMLGPGAPPVLVPFGGAVVKVYG